MSGKKIDYHEIVLATTNEENEAVYTLLSAFLQPNDHGIAPSGHLATDYKWEPIEKWLTEQMGREEIGARFIEIRDAESPLAPDEPVLIQLSRADSEFQIRLLSVHNGRLQLPYSAEYGMPVIDFINPSSKKRRAKLMTQEEFEKKMAPPVKKKAPPVKKNAPPVKKKSPPVKKKSPPIKKKAPPVKKIARDDESESESESEESEKDKDGGKKKRKTDKGKKKAGGKKKDNGRDKIKPTRPSKDRDQDSESEEESDDEDDDDKNNHGKKRKDKDDESEEESDDESEEESDDEDDGDKHNRGKKRKDQDDESEEESDDEDAGDKNNHGKKRKDQDDESEEESDDEDDGNKDNGGKGADKGKDPTNRGSNADVPIVLDDDDGDESAKVKAVIKALGKLRKLDTDEYWQEVCLFFCRDPENTKDIEIPGLKAPLRGYQAAMVYYVLSRYKTGIAAVGIADDMGLGKTFITIATIVIFHYLHSQYADVERMLASGSRSERRSHNRRGAVNKTACPDQAVVSRTYGIQCPCVPGSMAQFIVENIGCLPSVILVPPTLMAGWIVEWKKFVGVDTIKLRVPHAHYEKTEYYKGETDLRVSMTSDAPNYAEATWVVADANSGKKGAGRRKTAQVLRKGFPEGSAGVILTATTVAGELNKKFNTTADWNIPDESGVISIAKAHESSQLACAFIFFDEMHDIGPATKPIEFLDDVASQNVGPTIAVGLSGTLLTSGPKSWQHLLYHTFETADRFEKMISFGTMKLDNLGAQYKALKTNWGILERHLHLGTTDPKRRKQIAQTLKSVKNVCVDGICGEIIISRSKSDKFRGDDILALEPVKHLNYSLTIPKGSARNGIRKLCRGVRASVNEKYDAANTKWNAGKGPEPDREDIGYDLLHSQAESPVGPQAKSCLAYFRLYQCAVYPFLTRLYDRLDGKAFDAAHIAKEWAKPYTQELSLRNRTKENLVRVLENSNSPFWNYRDHLIGHSPKFQTLVKIIKRLIDLKTEPLDKQPDNGPADGSKVRHLVVFTESPLSAYLTTILLVESLGDQVEVLLTHAGLPEKPTKIAPNHSRTAFRQYFDEDCEEGAKNKILVGPYSILSTGHNLQARASEVVLMDVGRENHRAQAVTRLHRLGQRLPVKVHQLWDRRNMFEAHRMLRISSLKGVLPIQAFDRHDYVNWKYFTGEVEPSELSPPPPGPPYPALSPVPANPEAETSEEDEPAPRSSPFLPEWRGFEDDREHDEEDVFEDGIY